MKQNNLFRYVSIVFIGALIAGFGSLFSIIGDNNLITSVLGIIGGIIAVIGMYFYRTELLKVNRLRHQELIDVQNVLLTQINGEEVYTNDFKFIRELTEKRRRLEMLARTDQETNYSSEITELQEEINDKIDYLKIHLEEIQKYSTEEIRNIKLSEARKWAMKVNRKAKHAMTDIDIAMGKHDFLTKLGVAPEYIDQISYEIEEGHVSKDGMVYYYLCRFSEDSPERIIKNINGIEKDSVGYYVKVEPWELETEGATTPHIQDR